MIPAVAVKPIKRSVRSSFVGTAHYISPEVLKSEDVGPECDYWALGAIIFQMISGQPSVSPDQSAISATFQALPRSQRVQNFEENPEPGLPLPRWIPRGGQRFGQSSFGLQAC